MVVSGVSFANAPRYSDDADWQGAVPFNVTLTQSGADLLVSVQYNTTDNATFRTLAASNYTSFVTSQAVQINVNDTWNDTVRVTYQSGTPTSGTQTMLTLFPFFMVIGLLVYVARPANYGK